MAEQGHRAEQNIGFGMNTTADSISNADEAQILRLAHYLHIVRSNNSADSDLTGVQDVP